MTQDAAALPLPSGTVTFLFSDIEGSTRLLERLGPAYPGLLATHHRLLQRAFAENHGQVVDAPGDGFFVVFSRAEDAVRAAISAQKAIAAEAWPNGASVRVRMGLHTGEPMLLADRYVGIDVHRGARIAAAGHGGQVLLSSTTWSLAGSSVSTQADVIDLGEHRLKDLPVAERLLQLKVAGLPVEFPPPRTLTGQRHNFPGQATKLIGRERESDVIKALLARPEVRLVTLTGMGGMGKTRLAQEVGTHVEDVFPDGIWFVDLAPLHDPELVSSAIARTVGIQEVSGRPVFDSLKDYFKARTALLVLDNFEQILPAANLVSDLLANCPGLRVLVTSRSILKLSGEHEVPVPPLTLPDLAASAVANNHLASSEAVRLFVERAEAARPGIAHTSAALRAIAEICIRLDGLPLAIELAAARTRLLAPTEMLPRLTRRLPLLTGGPRNVPTRQQTLRGTIAWSNDLLAAEEQSLFHRFAVFAGGFTAEAAETVCEESSGSDVLNVLGSLLDKSLVQRHDSTGGDSRFSMLEMIREFASEHFEQSTASDELRRRHASYFVTLAEAGDAELRGSRQSEWLARLELEHDNFRAALTWAFGDGGDPELGARLAGALWWFWNVRGHFSEGRRWTVRAMEFSETDLPATRAATTRAMANFLFVQSDYGGARTLAKEARELYRQLGREFDSAWLQGLEAIAIQYQGDMQQARALLDDAMLSARSSKHAWSLAWMLRNSGRIAYDQEDAETAAKHLEEALLLARRIGDTRGIALSLHYLGVVALTTDTEKSGPYLAESVDLFRRIDDRRGLAWALHYLAQVALERGHSRDAQLFETESLTLRRDLGDKRGIAECLEGHASRLTLEGKAEDAIRIFATAAALREAIGAPGPPADQRRVRRYLEIARSALDPSQAAQCWGTGFVGTMDEAMLDMI